MSGWNKKRDSCLTMHIMNVERIAATSVRLVNDEMRNQNT